MKTMKLAIVAAFMIGIVQGLLLPAESSAVPTWSRKYQISCYMCHSGFPTRNAFGEAFKNNGYRMPGGADEAFTRQKNIQMGNEEWKKTTEAPVPGSLPQFGPLSIMVGGPIVQYKEETATKPQELYLEGPNSVSLWYGTSVGDNLTIVGGIGGFGTKDINSRIRAVWQFSPGFNLALGNAFSNISYGQSFQGGVRGLSSVLPSPLNYAELNFARGDVGGYSLIAGVSTNATNVNSSPGASNLDTPNSGNTIDDIRYVRGKLKLFGTGLLSGSGGTFGNGYNGIDNQVSIGAGLVSVKSKDPNEGGLASGSFKGETMVYGGDIQANFNNVQLSLAASRDSDLGLNNIIADVGYFFKPWLLTRVAYSNIANAAKAVIPAQSVDKYQPTLVPSISAYLAPNILLTGAYTMYLKSKLEATGIENQNTFALSAYAAF